MGLGTDEQTPYSVGQQTYIPACTFSKARLVQRFSINRFSALQHQKVIKQHFIKRAGLHHTLCCVIYREQTLIHQKLVLESTS